MFISNTDDKSLNPIMICIFTYKDILTLPFFLICRWSREVKWQTISIVLNADIPGSWNSKPLTLDDYLDLTMTQIVALDPIQIQYDIGSGSILHDTLFF